ncbi:MAG: SoxR reducing system RseC family protein [Clostridia bacterium]|nr:SoxR reducing system RseC family protein [Clostridia bacterium]
MRRIGEVTAVEGEWLEVTFCRPSDCEKCHACMGGDKTTTIRVKGKASVGDQALVELPASTVMKASFVAYVLPLVALIVCIFIATRLFPQQADVAGAIGALLGLGGSALLLVATEKKRRSNPKWASQLVDIIHREQGDDNNGNCNESK